MLRGALLAFAAVLPVSIALAQIFAFTALLLWAVLRIRDRARDGMPNPLVLPILVFIGWTLVASAIGQHPGRSFGRSHRLFMYLLPFAIPSAAARAPGGAATFAGKLVHAFLFGALLLGLYDVVRIPLMAARGEWLFGLGNMRDPQIHLTALLLLLAVGAPPAKSRGRWVFGLRLAAAAGGLLLHFKRGTWFGFLLALPIPVTALRRRRSAVVAVVSVALLLLAPPVRERLVDLGQEWSGRRGERRDLWTRTAPAMIRAHPLGYGPRAVRRDDLRPYGRVAPGLSHLHNNVLHIAVECGWPGIAAWLGWMGVALGLMLRRRREAAPGSPGHRMAVGILAAYTALHLNGLVEYNFGNSVILMLFMFLMGLAVALDPKNKSACGD